MSKNTLELLACFDEAENPIEPHARAEVHQKPYRFWHAATNIWIVSPDNQILCTKRSFNNEGNPNKWQTYVGGHVTLGENFEQNAVRELKEELGLTLGFGRLIFLHKEKSESYKHITVMYGFYLDQKLDRLDFPDNEIETAKWFTFDEYVADKNANTDNWCNSLDEMIYKALLEHQPTNDFTF